MASLTADVTDVVDAVKAYLEEPDLPFLKVYWGDQFLIPQSPAAAVEPMTATRTLIGTGLKARWDFSIAILIYHSKIGKIEENRREASALAGDVVAKFDQTRTLGGLVVDGYITGVDAGFGTRGQGNVFRIVRCTWEGFSQVIMPAKTGA